MTDILTFITIVVVLATICAIVTYIRLMYYAVKEGPKYRIQEDKDGYHVQVGIFPIWLTIKSFSDPDRWWAEANAKNLLDELNKEL